MGINRNLFLILISTLVFSCSQRGVEPEDETTPEDKPLVTTVGSDNTFEAATWNIEHFPKMASTTVSTLSTMIKNLDIDLIAMQEIEDIGMLNRVISNVKEWKSVVNNYPSQYPNYQRTAFIYKPEIISVSDSKYILQQHEYYFAYRPPLAAFIEVYGADGQVVFDFNIIVLHLKAMSGTSNENRRRESITFLENYISEQVAAGADEDFVVLGDWNDVLEDARDTNVYLPFLDRGDLYTFLTEPLISDYTYLGSYKNVIDHIMLTNTSLDAYSTEGSTKILKLEQQYSQYKNEISDHRPVTAIFKGINLQ